MPNGSATLLKHYSEVLGDSIQGVLRNKLGETRGRIASGQCSEKKEQKRKTAVAPEVNLAIKVLQVFNVNSITQTYEADFILMASWFDGALAGTGDLKSINWGGAVFRPELQVHNQKEIQVLEIAKALQPRWANKAKDGHMRMTMRMQGTLHSTFNLRDFPFDTQYLEVEVRVRMWKKCDIRLHLSPTDHSVMAPGRELVNDFVIFPHVMEKICKTSARESTARERHWKYTCKIPCQRIYHSYLYHVFPVLFILASFALLVFLLPPLILVDRLETVSTVMLTLVAYKFVIDDKIPNVHYLTFLDKYILSIFALLFVCAVENCVFYQYGAHMCPIPPQNLSPNSFPRYPQQNILTQRQLFTCTSNASAAGLATPVSAAAALSGSINSSGCTCDACCNAFAEKNGCDDCVMELCSAEYNRSGIINASSTSGSGSGSGSGARTLTERRPGGRSTISVMEGGRTAQKAFY
jgi:hypothetical protein